VRVDISRVLPVFADEVLVISRIKAKKQDGKKAASKEGYLEVVALDQLSNPPKAIARLAMPRSTAENLHRILGENLEKMGAELKSKKMPQQPKKIEPKKQEKGYFG